MHNPEFRPFPEHEIYQSEGICITLESSLLERIDTAQFSIAEFQSWTNGRGLQNQEDYPLVVHIRGSAPSTPNDIDGTGNGSFCYSAGRRDINLYIGNRLEAFDKNDDNQDRTTAELEFNDEINGTLVHEVEHYIESCNGNQMHGLRIERVIQEVIKFGLSAPRGALKTDSQLRDEINSQIWKPCTEEEHQQYLKQPEEIRAREAKAIYQRSGSHMLWLFLSEKPQ